jgi:hypothetical protein
MCSILLLNAIGYQCSVAEYTTNERGVDIRTDFPMLVHDIDFVGGAFHFGGLYAIFFDRSG